MNICEADGCKKPVAVKMYNLCENHYRRMKRNGSPNIYINKPWGEARTVRADGYIYITVQGKQVMEHRYVMENYLKRKLTVDEIVHHKDGNKQNNELENLQLMTNIEHSTHHGLLRTKEQMDHMRQAKHETLKKED